ncbi:hypothetical protein [Neisseria zalophi]|nr:hypothetical protein [Neisseria zalophi]
MLSTLPTISFDGLKDKITDNRLKTYNGISYYYDDLDNLIQHELADSEI